MANLPPMDRFSNEELIILRSALRAEMRKRGMADSVGSVGESLAIDYFRKTAGLPKLQLAPRGTKNVDALSRNGERFSIKTVCEAAKTGTVYPEVDGPGRQLFEHMLIVRLSEDWSLKSIHQLSWAFFVEVRAWDKRMNAWYVPITARVLAASRLIFAIA